MAIPPNTATHPSPAHAFPAGSAYATKIASLQCERDQAIKTYANPHRIAILGGGPAGLLRALCGLKNGGLVTVMEKRKQDAPGRENAVALKPHTQFILREYGVYQYLEEKGLIYPTKEQEFLYVRLKDLEEAMKAVIAELSEDPIIHYNAQLKGIHSDPNRKADLIIDDNGREIRLSDVDLVVVAEGAHSETNEKLLGNRRIAILPSIPVIAAIFKDDRPGITGAATFFQYVGRTMANTAVSVYYHARFLFSFFFMGEHFFNPDRKIVGALTLSTPKQNYLGCGLSRIETEEMKRVLKNYDEAKRAARKSKRANSQSSPFAGLESDLEKAKKEKDTYLNYWVAMSFCCANLLKIFQFLFTRETLHWTSWIPLDKVSVTEIGADRSDASCGTLGQTSYLLAGDTLATVDPTTGLGCNTALQTVEDFQTFLIGLYNKVDPETLRSTYQTESNVTLSSIHYESTNMRRRYRPDAVHLPEGLPTGG